MPNQRLSRAPRWSVRPLVHDQAEAWAGCEPGGVVSERARPSWARVGLDGPSFPGPPSLNGGWPGAPWPSRLPLVLSAWFGRDVELSCLVGLMAVHRCVTVTGPFGCGKSRLAAEAVQRLGTFETRVWVPLGDVTDGTRLAEHVCGALGLPAAAGKAALTELGAALAGRRVLLVLDDAEQLVATGGTGSVQALLLALPLAHVVVTSRRGLGMDGEHVVAVQPLPTAFDPALAESPADVLRHAAAALFVDRARTLLGRFDLDAAHCTDVLALVRSLDGLPLAIEIAASRLRTWSVRALRLQCAHGWAGLARAGAPALGAERHASMHAAIDVSWRLLDPGLRAVLVEMAEVDGAWTVGEVQRLIEPFGDAHAVLDALVADSLLQQRSAHHGHRFELLAVLRSFIRHAAPRHEDDAAMPRRRSGDARLTPTGGRVHTVEPPMPAPSEAPRPPPRNDGTARTVHGGRPPTSFGPLQAVTGHPLETTITGGRMHKQQ